jgi:predicted transcriptional regulator
MNKLPTPDDLLRAARRLGLTMPQVCQLACVSYITFWRWKNKRHSPRLDTVQLWLDVLENEAQKQRDRAA